MPARRDDALSDDPIEHYGFMVPAYPPDPIRSASALMLPCGTCGSAAGDYCRGPRFCPSRMMAALELMRSGETKDGAPVSPPPGKPGRPKGNGKKLSDDDRAEILRKYKAGVKITELSRQYDVAHTSIKYVLVKAGALNS